MPTETLHQMKLSSTLRPATTQSAIGGTGMTLPNTRSYMRSMRWSALASSAGGHPSMATFLLGLHKGVEAHELCTGLSNTLECIYNVKLCIVDIINSQVM